MNTNGREEPKWFWGVDPGALGCIAMYAPPQDAYPKGQLNFVDLKMAYGFKNKSTGHKDLPALVQALTLNVELLGKPKFAVVETPHSLPNDGHVGAFTFGKNCGTVIGILHGLEILQIETVPSVWKAQMNLSKSKKESIDLAIKTFVDTGTNIPQGSIMFEKPKDQADGRAEAALLAWMGAHKFGSKI